MPSSLTASIGAKRPHRFNPRLFLLFLAVTGTRATDFSGFTSIVVGAIICLSFLQSFAVDKALSHP